MPSDAVARPLRLAIEGCGHGTLHSIYASVEASCKLQHWPSVDLLIIGGDFQSVRNPHDLNCMSVPVKYRELGDFYEYYSCKRTAPYLTIFVGGNHEASNYLHELYYGGWVAPNIYYMGAANVLRVGGLRIAGLSGIWKGFDYRKPHHERVPYNDDQVKSAYHVRELDVRKLLQVRTQVDIGISHDWPKGVEWMGDAAWLFRNKNHFKEDADSGRLGSAAARYVLDRLRPPHWYSAHLHIKYAAVVLHAPPEDGNSEVADVASGGASVPIKVSMATVRTSNDAEIDLELETAEPTSTTQLSAPPANADEIDLELEDDQIEGQSEAVATASTNDTRGDKPVADDPQEIAEDLRAQLPATFSKPAQPTPPATLPFPPAVSNTRTDFLALDKCLPHRDFLQLLEIPRPRSGPDDDSELSLEYDPEWLAITRALHLAHENPPYLTLGDPKAQCPPDRGDAFYRPLIEESLQWVRDNLTDISQMTVPLAFERTARSYDPSTDGDWRQVRDQPREYANPQTQAFCDLLGIPNAFAISEEEALANLSRGPAPTNSGFRGGARGGWRGGHDRRGGRGGPSNRFGRGRGRGRGRGGRW